MINALRRRRHRRQLATFRNQLTPGDIAILSAMDPQYGMPISIHVRVQTIQPDGEVTVAATDPKHRLLPGGFGPVLDPRGERIVTTDVRHLAPSALRGE